MFIDTSKIHPASIILCKTNNMNNNIKQHGNKDTKINIKTKINKIKTKKNKNNRKTLKKYKI